MSRICDNNIALLDVSREKQADSHTHTQWEGLVNTFSDGVASGLGHQWSNKFVHTMLVEVLQKE